MSACRVLVLKMASYEPLDAIIDVPTVQEARSGEFLSSEECRTSYVLCGHRL